MKIVVGFIYLVDNFILPVLTYWEIRFVWKSGTYIYDTINVFQKHLQTFTSLLSSIWQVTCQKFESKNWIVLFEYESHYQFVHEKGKFSYMNNAIGFC